MPDTSRNEDLNNLKAALAVLRTADADCLDQMRRAIFHDDKGISIGAMLALGRLHDRLAVPYLIKAFRTIDIERGRACAWAMGELCAKEAVPFLVAAAQGGFVVENACEALGKIGSVLALSGLLDQISHEDEQVRASAIRAIGQLHFQGEEQQKRQAYAVLSKRLAQESSRRVRLNICVALHRINPQAAAALGVEA